MNIKLPDFMMKEALASGDPKINMQVTPDEFLSLMIVLTNLHKEYFKNPTSANELELQKHGSTVGPRALRWMTKTSTRIAS